MNTNPFMNVDFSKFMDMNRLLDWQKSFSDMKLKGVDVEAMMAAQRKNLEAMAQAQQLATEGMQAVARRQGELLQQMMEGTSDAVRTLMTAGNPEDKAAKQAEVAKQVFERAIANMRELAELVAKSNAETFEVMNKRVTEGLDEIKAMIEKKR